MKNTAHELLENITDPFSVFAKEAPKQEAVQEDNVVDAHVIEPTSNSIKEEFNRCEPADRAAFLHALVLDKPTCSNLLQLMLDDAGIRRELVQQLLLHKDTNAMLKNHFTNFNSQSSR